MTLMKFYLFLVLSCVGGEGGVRVFVREIPGDGEDVVHHDCVGVWEHALNLRYTERLAVRSPPKADLGQDLAANDNTNEMF